MKSFYYTILFGKNAFVAEEKYEISQQNWQANEDFNYYSCVRIKPGQEYIVIYLTGNDDWYVAHEVYDGQKTLRLRGE